LEWAFTRPLTKLMERAEAINSRIILAFDLYPKTLTDNESFIEKSIHLLENLKDHIVAVKIGLPTIMSIGLKGVGKIIKSNKEYYYIADVKFADIGYIGRLIVKLLDDTGFDALISHSIIGVEGSLKDVVDEVRKRNGALFSLCAMSHKGALEFLNKHFNELVEATLKLGVKAFILPATMPKYIREVREKYPDVIIASPGVGAQGAQPGSAVKAGADFEIIGRAIYNSPNPIEQAKNLKRVLQWKTLRS